jgi:hypothetical protein
MSIAIATDCGRPVPRDFVELPTATRRFFGAEPPRPGADPPRIWALANDHAYVMGITNPKGFGKTWVGISEGSNPVELIRSRVELFPEDRTWTIQPMNIPPGRYFPRMARPNHQHPGDFPMPFYPGDFAHERASASIQIATLADRLRVCFQVVGPSEPNFGVFGGEFRNILLLAATEVEAQWKAILRANGYDAKKANSRWSTKDYHKLEAALRLSDYAIEFPEYPWLQPVAPFRGWSPPNTTGSIPWYDAYNLVKHDREQHGHQATLIRSLEAVAAVVVMGVAQFGITFVRQAPRWRDLFQVREYPRWSIGDTHGNIYVEGDELAGEPISYPFPK